METIKTFEESDIEIKDSISSPKTITLKIGEKSYNKIKKYFDDGRPIGDTMNFNSQNYKWSLNIRKIPYADKSLPNKWKVWGRSGDSTFGGAPDYFQSKLSGNKKAAKDVYNQFIKKYNLK